MHLRQFLKNWSLLTLSNVIQQVINFIVIIPIARNLAPKGYGDFTIIFTLVGTAQIISSLGLRQIAIREIAREGNKLFSVAKETFYLTIISFIVTAVGLAYYLFAVEKIEDISLLVMSLLFLFTQVMWNYFEPLAFGKEKMEYSAFIGVIFSVIWGTIVLLLPKEYFTVTSIITIYVIVQFIRAAVYFWIEFRKGYFRKSFAESSENYVDKLSLLKQSLPLYGTTILTLPVTQIPIILLGLFSGADQVAFYGIGSKLSIPISIVASNLVNAIYPIMAKQYVQNRDQYASDTGGMLVGVICLGIFVSFFISLFSREIILLLFGDRYEPAILSFSIQVWVTLNLVVHSFIGTVFLTANKERLLVKLSVVNAVTIGMANYIGAHYGATGLSQSLYWGAIISFIFHWYFLAKKVGITYSKTNLTVMMGIYTIFGSLCFWYSNISLMTKILVFVLFSIFYLWLIRRIFNMVYLELRKKWALSR